MRWANGACVASTRCSPRPPSTPLAATTRSSPADRPGCPSDQRLKVGLIYSYAANEAVEDGALDEEGFETDALSADARTILDAAIGDYNGMFGTSFDTSGGRFQNYYKDLSLRLKQREIDLVIVVNMGPRDPRIRGAGTA